MVVVAPQRRERWLPHNVLVDIQPAQLVSWSRRTARHAAQALALGVVTIGVNITLFVLSVVAMLLTVVGIGLVATPVVTVGVRALADLHRRLAQRFTGVVIASPYRPQPEGAQLGGWQRYRWVMTDPATWRDLLWLLPSALLSLLLPLIPCALMLYGLEGLLGIPIVVSGLWVESYGYGVFWPLDHPVKAALVFGQGALLLTFGLLAAPHLLRAHAGFTRSLLAPTRDAELATRVRQLSESRADTVDAQAAELRRIERDLHDGAQARLISVSMNIGLAEKLMTRDPQAAQQLLAEARQSSGHALAELRSLVRGIHPPVLSERGLTGAVEALAHAVPLTVRVTHDVPGRLSAPVESAGYFAVAEALANVTKHSSAEQASIVLTHADGLLRIVVTDDGAGGADPTGGTGLTGMRRRLAAFDGTMTVASPPGGPTVVTMELPCELSSPKISPCSETA